MFMIYLQKVTKLQGRVDELEKARLKNVPLDTAKEILALKASIVSQLFFWESLQKHDKLLLEKKICGDELFWKKKISFNLLNGKSSDIC